MNVTTVSDQKPSPFGKQGLPIRSARELKRVGVVDVGSNSIRLVVFDGAARSPAYFYNEKVMAGLGQGLATTGRLNPEGVVRGMAALKRFAALARGMGIEDLTCVATAAVREAEDGPAFHRAVARQTGLKLVVIEGTEEARLSAQGVLLGWPNARGLVCDIGGNSMEVAEVGNGAVGRRASSPLGPFRLQQVEAKGLKRHIETVMEGLVESVGGDHELIYLVGGSWRAIARLDMERRGYPMTVLHEYRMTPDAVAATAKFIARASLSEMKALTGISASRLELVPLAVQVLRELVQTFQPREIAISSYGIREGLLYEQMSDSIRKRDPLIEAARFTERQMSRIPGTGKKLHQFLSPLFEGAPPERHRLVRAACHLHDTSWRAHPDYRAEACFDNVTRSNLAALSHPERVFLGLALLHRYKNGRAAASSPMAPLLKLLSDQEIRDAETLGRAMRFGAMFAIGDPAEAGALALDREAGTLTLTLTRTGRNLMAEVAEARLNALAAGLGVQAVVA
ncbi:Ppx/GppA family phosphatase [Paracoccus sp. (in: a-proteobacteria)]|uniref:Ppx/GppA family phosphatase n=1 Tax=Paracoccus sp. TaxID=267 RepID=UPI0026E0E058|nr:Ppx/GppA family phosphatase [Paracoccus sp. (in: a-proteobacteria)]MDO5371408.1 Ppx/GppA family phosphatase [Paracoccus sp. (in: a-proteobacteria)]